MSQPAAPQLLSNQELLALDGKAPEAILIDISTRLLARGQMLATAESCTGGMIAAACTDLAGSSQWFERGFVSYSNAAKTALLGGHVTMIGLNVGEYSTSDHSAFRALAQFSDQRSVLAPDLPTAQEQGFEVLMSSERGLAARCDTPADIREELLEPLLNGKQIMDLAGIKPGPAVGLIRDNLLQAQIAGDVNTIEEAERFVLAYREKEQL